MRIHFGLLDGRSAFLWDDDPLPPGAVAITEEEHAALLAGQAQGLEIVAGEDGRPELREPVLSSEARAQATRAERDARLHATDGAVLRHRDQVDAGGTTTLSPEEYAALLAYRQALRDVPAQAGFPDEIDWPA